MSVVDLILFCGRIRLIILSRNQPNYATLKVPKENKAPEPDTDTTKPEKEEKKKKHKDKEREREDLSKETDKDKKKTSKGGIYNTIYRNLLEIFYWLAKNIVLLILFLS